MAKVGTVRIVKGNKKLTKSIYSLNMGSATDCPSKKLGLCQACSGKKNFCFSLRDEKLYKNVLPARRIDAKNWNALSATEIGSQLIAASARAKVHKMKTFRFSVAGDFFTQKDVNKMTELCAMLKNNNVDCYGYTARTDLNLSELLKVASVQVSNNKSHWIKKGANRFKMVNEISEGAVSCKGDCRKCSLCVKGKGLVIEVKKH